ncbi:hypothetical protein JGS22_022100, partial [Streptomyces sp. P38-E01]
THTDPLGLAPCEGEQNSLPAVGPAEVWQGDVHGDVVVQGGTVEGDVHGTAIVVDGGTVHGNVQNAVQIGGHNVIGEQGPPGANTITGNVTGVPGHSQGVSVQTGQLDGGVNIDGERVWPLDGVSAHGARPRHVTNQLTGDVNGLAVQAGSVHGGVHLD